MAYVKQPPPSIEAMLDQFADWMAQHAQAKVSVRIEYRDGTNTTIETDHKGRLSVGLPAERDCCGTFPRTPHRATCAKYRGKFKPSNASYTSNPQPNNISKK